MTDHHRTGSNAQPFVQTHYRPTTGLNRGGLTLQQCQYHSWGGSYRTSSQEPYQRYNQRPGPNPRFATPKHISAKATAGGKTDQNKRFDHSPKPVKQLDLRCKTHKRIFLTFSGLGTHSPTLNSLTTGLTQITCNAIETGHKLHKITDPHQFQRRPSTPDDSSAKSLSYR